METVVNEMLRKFAVPNWGQKTADFPKPTAQLINSNLKPKN